MGAAMTKQVKRAALYVRVSTDAQTVENQIAELSRVAERRGWDVVEIYRDAGIRGAKGRDGRPGLDAMLKDASRRKFDVVMAWAIDRLGRSLVDLLGTIQGLVCGVDLYLEQQKIDTTTPAGKLMFQITGAFAEFERALIRERTGAGRIAAKKRGVKFGRPPKLTPQQAALAARLVDQGQSVPEVASTFGVHEPSTAASRRERRGYSHGQNSLRTDASCQLSAFGGTTVVRSG
jgi:DNA invertase Pin-like site-specific DNA recombinase